MVSRQLGPNIDSLTYLYTTSLEGFPRLKWSLYFYFWELSKTFLDVWKRSTSNILGKIIKLFFATSLDILRLSLTSTSNSCL